jgi:hypothetical protein
MTHCPKKTVGVMLAGGSVPDRNQQFEPIEALKNRSIFKENPVFSIGTQKKELLGTLYRAGRDTSQFACDSFRWFWYRIGPYHYPNATSILWLGDAGGSHNCRHCIFKQDLQNLVNELGIEICMAHYPTYCSKFNPINSLVNCESYFFCRPNQFFCRSQTQPFIAFNQTRSRL